MGAGATATVLPNGSTLPMAGSSAPLDGRSHSLAVPQGFRLEDGTGGADSNVNNVQSPIDLVPGQVQKIVVPAGATEVLLMANCLARVGHNVNILNFQASSALPAGPQTPADGDGQTIGSGAGWFPIPFQNMNYRNGQAPSPVGTFLKLGVAGMPYFYIGAQSAGQVFFLFHVNSAF